jgi:hypothetical protein
MVVNKVSENFLLNNLPIIKKIKKSIINIYIMKTLGKENMGIVGFSYEVTNKGSTKPRITKRELGRKTDRKVEVAHGVN